MIVRLVRSRRRLRRGLLGSKRWLRNVRLSVDRVTTQETTKPI